MKKRGTLGSQNGGPRKMPKRTIAEGVAADLSMVVQSRRPSKPGPPVGSRLSHATLVRQPSAVPQRVSSAVSSAPIAASPLQVADGSDTIDAKLLRLTGAHRRVMVVGRDLDSMGRALVANGCQVVLANITNGVTASHQRLASSRAAMGGPRTALARGKSEAGRFDVVALRHTFEYAADPVGLLSGLRKQLTSDGHLVAAIPNVTHGSLRLRLLAGQSPFGWLSPVESQARYYDDRSIKLIFERAGFVITRFERHRETFDAAAPSFNGTPLPAELVAQLMCDADALTSAFVLVAHRSPLSTRTFVDLRVNELVEAMEGQSRTQRERVEVVDRRVESLSNHVNDLKQAVDVWQNRLQAPEPALQGAQAALEARNAEAAALVRDLQRLQYEQLIGRMRLTLETAVPPGAIVLVVSKGDDQLLKLSGRTGWHFLQTAKGVYAGHHPADSREAIAGIARLRAKGARYLVFPQTALWWLDHYAEFSAHLNKRFRRILQDPRTCVIYSLDRPDSRS